MCMKKRIEKSWVSDRTRILFFFLLTGVFVGACISLFRIAIPIVLNFVKRGIEFGKTGSLEFIIFIVLYLVFGAIIGKITLFEPMIAGSGIPVVFGILDHNFKISWLKVLLAKFVAGTMAVGSGLTLGREGPSVQLGAAIGQGVFELSGEKEEDKKYFIAGGAGAGIAAAFNAPLTGILFSVEEVLKRANRKIFLSSGLIVFAAIITSNLILGLHPALHNLPKFHSRDLEFYPMYILLGVCCGLSGILFNTLMIKGKNFNKRIKLPIMIKYLIPFLVTGLILFYDSSLIGSGEELIFLPVEGNVALGKVGYYYVAKLLLLALAFSSGLPGGSLVTLLVLGSLVGNIFGLTAQAFGLASNELIIILSVLAMCGHFSAIVRSPLTGIILIFEISGGSFDYLLPLGIVSYTAFFVADYFGIKPLYDSLLELMLKPKIEAFED